MGKPCMLTVPDDLSAKNITTTLWFTGIIVRLCQLVERPPDNKPHSGSTILTIIWVWRRSEDRLTHIPAKSHHFKAVPDLSDYSTQSALLYPPQYPSQSPKCVVKPKLISLTAWVIFRHGCSLKVILSCINDIQHQPLLIRST